MAGVWRHTLTYVTAPEAQQKLKSQRNAETDKPVAEFHIYNE